MGDAGFFKGTSADQDTRFSNKHKKLLKSMKFPPEFDQKVDFSKVNLAVLKPWIATEITKMLGFEDDVIIDFTFGLLETQKPDPKEMQINLTGFFEGKTQEFLLNLWKLLLSAQESVGGIPASFLEAKKEQIRQQQLKDEEAKRQQKDVMDNIRKRRDAEEDGRRNQRYSRGRADRDRYDDDRFYRSRGGDPYERRRSRSQEKSYRRDRYRGDRYERRRDDSGDRYERRRDDSGNRYERRRDGSPDRYRPNRRRSRTPEPRRSRYSRSPSPRRSNSPISRSRPEKHIDDKPDHISSDLNEVNPFGIY
ncbi:PWI domain-containing protein [Umbelopsis sp. PMI_123]|nr:PWI domain-containing protein [Umbelopsis sp. PMI_123]